MIQCRLTVLDRVTSSAYMYMYNYIQVIYKPDLTNLSPEYVGMVLNTEFYRSVLHQVVNFVHKKNGLQPLRLIQRHVHLHVPRQNIFVWHDGA